jgi:tetratricopeptide (TPR) repeat protein
MKPIFLLISLALCAGGTRGQNNVNNGYDGAAALKAFNNKDWNQAISIFKMGYEKNPADLRVLYYLGIALANQGQYAEASDFLTKAMMVADLKPTQIAILFQLARASAGLNENEKALGYLNEAVRRNATYPNLLSDPLFDRLKTNPEFTAAEEKLRRQSTPCLYEDQYKEFDFFVGVWDVYVGEGFNNKVGVDSVLKSEGGCSIHENFSWPSAEYTGVSMIFFDPGTQKYRMCWAGNAGDIRNFEEIRKSGDTIQLLAITNTSTHELVHRRMTLAHDDKAGTVYEYIENSFDLGKSWHPDFIGLFRKRKLS